MPLTTAGGAEFGDRAKTVAFGVDFAVPELFQFSDAGAIAAIGAACPMP